MLEMLLGDNNVTLYENLPTDFVSGQEFVLLYRPLLIKALRELGCPHPGDAGVFLSQVFFWLRTKYGYYTKDGLKWIHNSYAEWVEQIAGLSVRQFGVVARWLQNQGLILKSNYAELKPDYVEVPRDWHQWQTKSWITLDTECLRELTGYVFEEPSVKSTNQPPKAAPSAEIQNRTSRAPVTHDAKSKIELPSLYRENSISTKDPLNLEKETDDTVKTLPDWLLEDPWADPVEVVNDGGCSVDSQSSSQAECPAAPHTTEVTETTVQGDGELKVGNNGTLNPSVVEDDRNSQTEQEAVPHEPLPVPKLKQPTPLERQQYIWEESVGYPNEYFLNWRYETHYKPQGGKWETGGRAYARKEFYNDPAGADVIYQEFLEFFNRVANNANQQQNQKIQAILPACLAKLPSVTQENKEQVAENIATVAARGAGVALRGNFAPGSNQHISFAEAAQACSIKALPNLEQPALPGGTVRHWREELSEAEKFENDFALNCAKWKNVALRQKAIEWANQNSDKVVITEFGLERIHPMS